MRDDAQGALRPQEKLTRVWAGCRRRHVAELHGAGWRDDAHANHIAVDATVTRGFLACRAAGNPTADSGVLEGLREVTSGEAGLGQFLFQVGAENAGLNGDGAGDLVNVDDLVKGGHGHCDGLTHATVNSLHAADDRGAAAEGDDCNLALSADLEQVLDMLFSFR